METSGVGEHCIHGEVELVRVGGEYTRENAGMSSEKESENLSRRKPKGS